MIERIFISERGYKIDLHNMRSISEIKKDALNNIYFDVHVCGIDKPIQIILANCIGIAPESTKKIVQKEYDLLSNSWIMYFKQQLV